MKVSTFFFPVLQWMNVSVLCLPLFGCIAKLYQVVAQKPQSPHDAEALVTEEPTPPILLSAKRVRTKQEPHHSKIRTLTR